MFYNKLKIFLKTMAPRYHLALDSYYFCFKRKETIYRFKVFGDTGILSFSYSEIYQREQLLYDINPKDLLKIALSEKDALDKANATKLIEILRDNKFKLSSHGVEQVFSGDEICQNVLLIEKY